MCFPVSGARSDVGTPRRSFVGHWQEQLVLQMVTTPIPWGLGATLSHKQRPLPLRDIRLSREAAGTLPEGWGSLGVSCSSPGLRISRLVPSGVGPSLPGAQGSASQPQPLGWVRGLHLEARQFLGDVLQGSGPSCTWEVSLLPNSVMGVEDKEGISGVCVNVNSVSLGPI